jgi:hypothetical protein
MPRPCEICCHPKRLQIDRGLVQGKNMTEMSRVYGVNYNSLWHHKENHLSRQLMKSEEIRQMSMAETVAADVSGIYRRLNELLDGAQEKNNTQHFLQICAEIRQYSEFLVRLSATFQAMADREKQNQPSDGVLIDLSGISDEVLLELIKKLSVVKGEDGLPIRATGIKEVLH